MTVTKALFRAVLLASWALLAALPQARADTRTEVDLQLVLAADTSGSIRRDQSRAQRDGFIAAFRDPALRNAILSGPLGRIAVTYIDWSSEHRQSVIVPWRLIDSADAMAAFADELAAAELSPPGPRTSISAAMLFARDQIEMNRYVSFRSVVDISGNGTNNSGPSMQEAGTAMRESGITVNGLVLPTDATFPGLTSDAEEVDLPTYYRNEVRQGIGAFVVVVAEEPDFSAAILRKLVLEVAWAD